MPEAVDGRSLTALIPFCPMDQKTSATPGYAKLAELVAQDALVRTLIERIEVIRDECESALYSVDQLEQTVRRLLKCMDATPPDVLLAS